MALAKGCEDGSEVWEMEFNLDGKEGDKRVYNVLTF